jgi:hypothetical protein
MADPREDILVRLAEIISAISGVETAGRNLDEIGDAKLPAIILYDGDDEAFDNPRAVGAAGNVVHMLPAIVLSLGDVPENVGTTSNLWRAKILKAILLDATIGTICRGVPNGGIRYLGCTTSLAPGRSSQVQMIFNFTIAYPFKPTSL